MVYFFCLLFCCFGSNFRLLVKSSVAAIAHKKYCPSNFVLFSFQYRTFIHLNFGVCMFLRNFWTFTSLDKRPYRYLFWFLRILTVLSFSDNTVLNLRDYCFCSCCSAFSFRMHVELMLLCVCEFFFLGPQHRSFNSSSFQPLI